MKNINRRLLTEIGLRVNNLIESGLLTITSNKEYVIALAENFAKELNKPMDDCYNAICFIIGVSDFAPKDANPEIIRYISLGLNEKEARMIIENNIPFEVVNWFINLNIKYCDESKLDLENCIRTWQQIGNDILEYDMDDVIFYVEHCFGLPAESIKYYKYYGVYNVKGAYMCGLELYDFYCEKFKLAAEIPAFYKENIILPRIVIDTLYEYDFNKNIEKVTLNEMFGVWAPIFAFISPVQILGKYADKKEIHRFFIETKDMDLFQYDDDNTKILDIYLQWAGLYDLRSIAYSEKLFKWAKDHWNNADMTRVRRLYGPAGAMRDYTYRELIGQLDDSDVLSQNDSVERVFTRMNDRIEKIMNKEENIVNYEFPTPPYPGNEHIVHIHDYKTLVEVGKFMKNCARSYADAIRTGKTTLYQVNDGGKNVATMEVANGRVYQLYDAGNTQPANSIIDIVDKWAKENNIIFDLWK